jgi:hypothetical protein
VCILYYCITLKCIGAYHVVVLGGVRVHSVLCCSCIEPAVSLFSSANSMCRHPKCLVTVFPVSVTFWGLPVKFWYTAAYYTS